MLNLSLLVQLFGREVLDSLARAGFDDEAAISGAGPNRLAAESGISLPLAQRIVAVVEETRGPSPGPRSETPDGPPAAPRKPRRRKAPARRTVLKTPATRIEASKTPAEPDQADPFVDDVALVAWMGFSSSTPSGRLSYSVADGILDHVGREPPAPEETRGDQPEEGPAPPAISTETGTPSRTLPGSFWSFGRPSEPTKKSDHEVARPAGRPPDQPVPAGALPRRNRHDH